MEFCLFLICKGGKKKSCKKMSGSSDDEAQDSQEKKVVDTAPLPIDEPGVDHDDAGGTVLKHGNAPSDETAVFFITFFFAVFFC
jgi:hypothetical protein